MPAMIGRRSRGEQGSSEVVSFLGVLPFVLIIMIAILQLTMFSYVLVVTESAVRDGGRAAASRNSVYDAVRRVQTSSGVVLSATEVCPPGEGYVRVTVVGRVPMLFFRSATASELFSVERTVVMPREGNCP